GYQTYWPKRTPLPDGKSSTSICRLCEEDDETPIHLICACPRMRMEMYKLAEDMQRKKAHRRVCMF
ncbi:Hypothetical protein FKW44_004588, partial [Caligus rogercresseyi]